MESIGPVLTAAIAVGMMAAAATAQDTVEGSALHPPPPQGTVMQLAGPFHARSAWRLVVSEGAPTRDYGDNDAPGALRLCLHNGPAGPCVSGPVTLPLRKVTSDDAPAWEPHYLLAAKVVHPQGSQAAPLLLIVTGSLNSGDGDQIVATQLLAYDAGKDAFRCVDGERTGRNNNQETRFLDGGPLRGSVVSAEPQDRAPYGYWITLYRPTQTGDYRPVLRYRSAILYNDGNPLAVIDSEAPNIERRLGLWKVGQPIPTASTATPSPAPNRCCAALSSGATDQSLDSGPPSGRPGPDTSHERRRGSSEQRWTRRPATGRAGDRQGSVRAVSPPVRPVSLSPPADAIARRTARLVAMVHELHKAGYQRLRVSPGLSPSGVHWRCSVTCACNVQPDGFTAIDHTDAGGLFAAYSSASPG